MAELKTLARPYARAAFEHADEKGKLADWGTRLLEIAAVCADAKIASVLSSPEKSAEQRAGLIIDLLGNLEPDMVNFVGAMAEQNRLGLMQEVAALFQAMKAQREQTVDVVIHSAFELTGEQQTQLEQSLKNTLKRQVNLACDVDASLIGGVRINAGDTVIDASVRGRLTKLAEAINS